MPQVVINVVQTCVLSRDSSQSGKQAELRSATQTWTAFQTPETIKQSQKVKTKSHKTTEYFTFRSLNYESYKKECPESTQQIHKDFDDVFSGIWCFEGTFSLQLKPDSKPYQAPPRHVAYALQKPFQEELERLQKQDIIPPLGVDDTSK